MEQGESVSVGGGGEAGGVGVQVGKEWSEKETHEMGQDNQWNQNFRFVARKEGGE